MMFKATRAAGAGRTRAEKASSRREVLPQWSGHLVHCFSGCNASCAPEVLWLVKPRPLVWEGLGVHLHRSVLRSISCRCRLADSDVPVPVLESSGIGSQCLTVAWARPSGQIEVLVVPWAPDHGLPCTQFVFIVQFFQEVIHH